MRELVVCKYVWPSMSIPFFCTNLGINDLHSFFYKNVVFLAQAEYSYFSADFRLKIFLYYS